MTVSNTFCACFVKCDQELHPAHVTTDIFFKPVMPNQWLRVEGSRRHIVISHAMQEGPSSETYRGFEFHVLQLR